MLKSMAAIGFIALHFSIPTGAWASAPGVPDDILEYLARELPHHSLPKGAYAAVLKKWFADSGRPEPWSIQGDFDGDSVVDWAGLLADAEGRLDLVVVRSSAGTRTHAILASPGLDTDGIYVGVELEPPGEVHGFPFENGPPDPVVITSNPSIHLYYYEKSSVLYYWNGDSFSEMWTSD